MNKKNRVISMVMAATIGAVGLTACSKTPTSSVGNGTSILTNDTIPTIRKTSTELTYHSSDRSLADFMNDFYSRNVRNGDDAIGNVQLGKGATYQKTWETNSVVWFDSSINGLGSYDALENIKTYLSNIEVDVYGNVYSYPAVAASGLAGTSIMGMGWPFPTYNRPANALPLYGVEFNQSNEMWTVNGLSGQINKGFLCGEYNGPKGESLTLQSPTFTDADGSYASFVELDLRIEDMSEVASYGSSAIGDYYLCWKTEKGGDTWYKVSYKDFSVNPQEFESNSVMSSYFPMYLHSDWDGQKITDLKIEIVPKENKNLNVNVKLNYLRMMTDTRNSTNGPNFIASLEKYVMFTGDTAFLKKQITRARKAMLFQLEALDGKNGMIDLSYLRGHSSSQGLGSLAQNGFWDTLVTCNKNLEANYLFVKSLYSLARLEQYLTDSGERVEEVASVRNPSLGGENITYSETPESLETLAEKVTKNLQKNVADGGFWNPATGRFAWGIQDENPKVGKAGDPLDYGYTELNLRMIYEGLATQTQAASIMSWLNGERTVSGDTSTGDDIYFYEFGPRVSTKNNSEEYNAIWAGKTIRWASQCQNGGVILYISFYDLMARNIYAGANDSYERLKAMQSWYDDVKSYGGNGISFYDRYYLEKQIDPEIGGDCWTLQGGTRGNGAIGLDGEFYESALVYTSVPYMYFGLNSTKYKTLTIAPDLPDSVEWFALENLMFSKIPYDCYVTNDAVIISGVRGEVNGERVDVSLKEPSASYVVKVNGVETTDYRKENGKIIVNVPLSHVKVSVEKK